MRASSASLLFSCVRTSHQVFTSRRWEGRNAKWLLCVSSGGLLASFYCPCHQTSSERGGLEIPLSVCCLILAPDAPVHAHTHTQSVSFSFVGIQCASSRPRLVEAVGSSLPPHFHNLLSRDRRKEGGKEGAGQRGDSLLSLSSCFFSVPVHENVIACRTTGAKLDWLHDSLHYFLCVCVCKVY